MINTKAVWRIHFVLCLILTALLCSSCKKTAKTDVAFYYWKQNFQLNKKQIDVLTATSGNKIYVRFFDIKWDDKSKKPYPEAIIRFKDHTTTYDITPVLFITNQTFEKLGQRGADSLAVKCHTLLAIIAFRQKIDYSAIQVDCDWTVGTKEAYFRFLKALKAISGKNMEATIRLHQVKYPFKTGIPPVERGVLMFYNMDKLSADLKAPNSIYNAGAAKKYVGSLKNYLLPLDIALPVFSWTLQIREGKLIQVYEKIGRAELSDKQNFIPTAQRVVYRARRDFFTGGIYIKKGDLFKLEETDKILLKHAAVQLSAHLNDNENRTIIYYELGNLSFSKFQTKDFKEISTYF